MEIFSEFRKKTDDKAYQSILWKNNMSAENGENTCLKYKRSHFKHTYIIYFRNICQKLISVIGL